MSLLTKPMHRLNPQYDANQKDNTTPKRESVPMKMFNMILLSTAVLMTPLLHAETTEQQKTLPYGDNPNIFKVLAHKTGSAIQNTAEKVGAATEKGIAKIKPQFDETVENTQAAAQHTGEVIKDNTRRGLDAAAEKIENTKDRIMGNTATGVPIEQKSLSQNSSAQTYVSPIAPQATSLVANTATASTTQLDHSAEPAITKQSLALDSTPESAPTADSTASASEPVQASTATTSTAQPASTAESTAPAEQEPNQQDDGDSGLPR